MSNPLESNNLPSLGELLKESLREGKTPILTVISNSMAPLLQRGDQVGLQAIDLTQLESGHIVTFSHHHQPGEMITHRIAGIAQVEGKTKLITWADRTLMFDPPIEIDDVIGRVIWRIRKGHRILLDQGRGLWLSNKLSKLATTEVMWITKLNIYNDDLSLEAIARSDILRVHGKKVLWVRIYRRINSIWAKTLTALVNFIPE